VSVGKRNGDGYGDGRDGMGVREGRLVKNSRWQVFDVLGPQDNLINEKKPKAPARKNFH